MCDTDRVTIGNGFFEIRVDDIAIHVRQAENGMASVVAMKGDSLYFHFPRWLFAGYSGEHSSADLTAWQLTDFIRDVQFAQTEGIGIY